MHPRSLQVALLLTRMPLRRIILHLATRKEYILVDVLCVQFQGATFLPDEIISAEGR